jgi:hypothetical protein
LTVPTLAGVEIGFVRAVFRAVLSDPGRASFESGSFARFFSAATAIKMLKVIKVTPSGAATFLTTLMSS